MRLTARWPSIASIVPFIPRDRGLVDGHRAARYFRACSCRDRWRSCARSARWSIRASCRNTCRTAWCASPSARSGASRSAFRSASWSALSQRAHTALWPLLLFFQAIGDIAWLPILVIWFGYGLITMTFVIVYTVIFPVVLNTVLGVRSIPITMHRAALSLGASRARMLWEVVLPGALPNIVTGLRNGLGYGWRALIATEIIVGTSGIGFLMFDARRAGSVVEILLGMIILGILWYIVDSWILAPIERATGQRWGLVTR